LTIVSLLFLFILVVIVVFKSFELVKITEHYKHESFKFDAISAATNDAVWDYDIVNKTVWYNKKIYSLFGYTTQEMEDNTLWWESNIHDLDRERVINHINDGIASNVLTLSEKYRFKHKKGHFIDINDQFYICRNDSGTAVRLIGVMCVDNTVKIDELSKFRKSMAEKVLFAEEVERKRISHKINEDVNQLIAAGNLSLIEIDAAAQQTAGIDQAKVYLKEAITKLRKISNELSPHDLQFFGFVDMVKHNIQNITKERKLKINFNANLYQPDSVDAEKELFVYRSFLGYTERLMTQTYLTQLDFNLETRGKKILVKIQEYPSRSGSADDVEDLKNILNKIKLFGGAFKVSRQPDNLTIDLAI
jgi:signal transduction histidine kinase